MSKVFKVFLASSGELAQEREAIKELINNYQNVYIKFEIVMWEDMSKSFTPNGIQEDTINPALKDSDIVITLFHSKVGKFTKKEFDIAFDGIMNKTKPNYLFFYYTDIENEKYKISPKDRALIKEHDKVLELIDYITEKEQVPQEFDSIEMLKSDIEKQLRLIEKKELNPESVETRSSKVTDDKEQEIIKDIEIVPKICIYTASPLDGNINYSIGDILNLFRKYRVELYHKVLTEDELIESREFDYNLIFTKTNNEKIITEDEFFLEKSISLDELEELINVKNTILFLDNDIENTQFDIKVISEKKVKKVLGDFLYDSFKNIKGICQIHHLKTELPDLIDTKNLLDFIGRGTELESIISKILKIKEENKVLTIKASGGIGKTAFISKAAVEFSKRGKFKDGIKFVQCEFIKDYEDFENKITFAFDMNNAMNFKQQLKDLSINEERLIILDNVETLLHVDDTKSIKDLIKLISDYATVVITSRETLNVNGYEKIHELKALTTDEAELLFLNLYKIRNCNKTQLRVEILENLLNHNPLAIKLVTSNLSKGKSTEEIKKELDESFFEITSEDIEKMFDKESDTNIERTKSLFHSINYSYTKLNEKEKLALKLLSLFPDGLHSEYFKYFYNQKVDKNITDVKQMKEKLQEISNIKSENFSDRDLKSLEDKSLIINNNQFINLQSIIGRFADFKFFEIDEEEKINYYKKAYKFNAFLNDIINHSDLRLAITAHLFDNYKNNFTKSFEYIQHLEFDEKALLYINDIVDMFAMNSAPNKKIIFKLNNLKKCLNSIEFDKNAIDAISLNLQYFYGDFDEIFEIFQTRFPIHEMTKDTNSNILLRNVLSIYMLEGYVYDRVKFDLQRNYLNDASLFLLGEYNFAKELIDSGDWVDNTEQFFDFELALNMNFLNINDLKFYIKSLYKTQHIEKIQTTYTMLKFNSDEIELKNIKKLIVTNPFTDGLQTLMIAIKDEESCSKIMFEEAIEKLYHIKYYHVEGILFYSKYLKKIDSEEYAKWFKIGKDLANKHYYRFLLHQFNCLETNVWKEYNEDDYPLPEKLDYSGIIKKYNLKGLE